MKRRMMLFAPTGTNRNNGALACNSLNNPATTTTTSANMFCTNANPANCAGNSQACTYEENGALAWNPGGLRTLVTRARNYGRELVGVACAALNALNSTTSCPLPVCAS